MPDTKVGEKPRGIARILPILDWAPRYDRKWLRADLVAGIAVAALVVPKSLGYADIAGVPIQHGLYAAAAGTILYALFGTAKQISTGPSSALAAVAGSAVLVASVSDEDAVTLVAAITLLAGVLFLLLALFKMGWISQFLSKAVITGFLFGAAIEVVVGELAKLTGTSIDGSNSWQKMYSWLVSLADIHGATLLLGLVSLAVIIGVRFSPIKVPGALVLVVGGLAMSVVFDLGDRGIALVGDVPRGFAGLAVPDLSFVLENIAVIGPAALGLLLIGFSQTAGDARSFAAKHRYRVDINQESVAQGMANVGSGLLQGIPVSTSLSASSLNDESGARTPLASLTTGVLIVLTLLFLAPLFADLPKPVLAALIIDAVVFGMMDVAEMKRLYRVARVDFWIAIAAILGVLSAGVLAGVMIGVVLSVGWLVYVSATPNMPVLGRRSGTQVFRSTVEYPDGETYPGLLVLRFDAGLHFGSSDALEDRLRQLSEDADPALHTAVVDFEGVNFIDSQGSDKVSQLLDLAKSAGIELRLARVKPHVLALLRRDGVIEKLGENKVFDSVYSAVEDHIPEATDS
ncbi:MAG: sulfate permease [Actinobacteria bacterium]|nr:sulfate permease [Actinomycetota bacterium]MCZ6630282.1 sulfate permease [Actinomycetota bacterium]